MLSYGIVSGGLGEMGERFWILDLRRCDRRVEPIGDISHDIGNLL
jgi:hypothetical protein